MSATVKNPTGLNDPTFLMLLITTVRLGVPTETAMKILGEETVQPVHDAEVMAISVGAVIASCPVGVLLGRVSMSVIEMVALLR